MSPSGHHVEVRLRGGEAVMGRPVEGDCGPVWDHFSETRLQAEQAYLISCDLKNLLSIINKVFGCPDYCW